MPLSTAEAKKAADVGNYFCNLHFWQRLPGHSILYTLRSELGEGGTPSWIRCLLWSLPGTGSCRCIKSRDRELGQLKNSTDGLIF